MIYFVTKPNGKIKTIECDVINDCHIPINIPKSKDKEGYFRIRFGSKNVNLHRLVYAQYISDFDPKLLVCHTCDNPPCINPKHLFTGTNQDNMTDKMNKGRQGNPGKKKGTAIMIKYICPTCGVEFQRPKGYYGSNTAHLRSKTGKHWCSQKCSIKQNDNLIIGRNLVLANSKKRKNNCAGEEI